MGCRFTWTSHTMPVAAESLLPVDLIASGGQESNTLPFWLGLCLYAHVHSCSLPATVGLASSHHTSAGICDDISTLVIFACFSNIPEACAFMQRTAGVQSNGSSVLDIPQPQQASWLSRSVCQAPCSPTMLPGIWLALSLAEAVAMSLHCLVLMSFD